MFYGTMIAEGVLGVIWVTLGLSFYESPEALAEVIKNGTPTLVVQQISMTLMGPVGGVLAILGVVVLPVSTGDTAFRCARLLVADTLKISQKSMIRRLTVAMPLFAAGIALTFVKFDIIWRYFGWANQTMACVSLWAVAVYLSRREKFHWIATVPALFMTVVCVSFLCYAKIGFSMPMDLSTGVGVAFAAAFLIVFLRRGRAMPVRGNEAAY